MCRTRAARHKNFDKVVLLHGQSNVIVRVSLLEWDLSEESAHSPSLAMIAYDMPSHVADSYLMFVSSKLGPGWT
jgi:hypothetical protein